MPAAAVIWRMQALSGFIGLKGPQADRSVVKSHRLTMELPLILPVLSLEGRRNMTCSGEMHRYVIEHQLREGSLRNYD